ncbi:helix-turn-helix domain-containing protein [Trinickia mobilis]|uniref:helix-turn-helix domain-containing protein n=1 Tax=Trinickia mobilis TaxID=2816356 RepID=UPI001A8FC569|nr:helix-turn-helix domain-containing protein [Trinickia mobilis]
MHRVVSNANDVTAHLSGISGWEQSYYQMTPGKIDCALDFVESSNVQMFHERFSEDVAQYGAVPLGVVSFALPVRSSRAGTLLGKPFDAGNVYVVRAGQEFITHTTRQMETLVFAISVERLKSAAEWAYPTVNVTDRSTFAPLKTTLGPELSVLVSLFRDANDAGPKQRDTREPLLEDSLIDLLLQLVAQNGPLERVSLTEAVRCELVKRCREIVLARNDNPVSILELCQALRVSRRALQEAFLSITGTTPLYYLRAIRLGTVRQLLQSDEHSGKTIGDIAASLGFFHLGRLTGDYKQLFSELPSETRQRRFQKV